MTTDTSTDNTTRNVSGPFTHGYVDAGQTSSSRSGAPSRGLSRRVPSSLVALANLMGTYTRGAAIWLEHLSPIDAEDIRLLALVCVLAGMFILLCVAAGYGIGAGISAYHLGLGAF